MERGHRTLTKVVAIPLAPRTADRSTWPPPSATDGPVFLP